MRRFKRYLALSPVGRTTVRRSLLLLPMVALLLRLRGMAKTRALLERLGRGAQGGYPALAPAEMVQLVDAVASVLHSGCLSRSLVLWHLLYRAGIAAEIRLGVSLPQPGELCAHAWVELDRRPINDSADVARRYAELPERAGGACVLGGSQRSH